jgi:hypothetical protein
VAPSRSLPPGENENLCCQRGHWSQLAHETTPDEGYQQSSDPSDNTTRPSGVAVHSDRQDVHSEGWQHLLALIDEAAASRTVFKPFVQLSEPQRRQIITLPPTIAKLPEVKQLVL